MKIGIRGDDHFALNSSIILGNKGSTTGRLDSLINSYKWFYDMFYNKYHVDMTVDLGDLTDNSTLRSEEITAITEAYSYRNDKVPELYILGNHERLSSNGEVNAVNFLKSMNNYDVSTEPSYRIIDRVLICTYPYVFYDKNEEENLKTFVKSLDSIDKKSYDRKLLFTHNDIYGADLGGWISKGGIDPNYLSKNFDMIFNGHIHNGSWVKKNLLNLGSLSGQNFSSKFVNWEPSVAVYDTDTNKVKLIENPKALRFLTVTAKTKSDLVKKLSTIDPNINYGVSVKVPLKLIDESREILAKTPGVMSSRVQEKLSKSDLEEQANDNEGLSKFDSSTNGYEILKDYIKSTTLPKELSEAKVLSVIHELEGGYSNEN